MFPISHSNLIDNSGNEFPVSYPHLHPSFLHDITNCILTPNSNSNIISNIPSSIFSSPNPNSNPNSNKQEEEDEEQEDLHPQPQTQTCFFYLPSPFGLDDVFPQHQHNGHDHVHDHDHDHVHDNMSLQYDSQVPPVHDLIMTEAADNSITLAAADDHQTTSTTATPPLNHNFKMVDWDSNLNDIIGQPQIPKRRSSKRDRHSKINTARGPRDRRMRLSLEVARKFFGLQDVLGFDKASKTVEWLLIQAGAEIKKLARDRQLDYKHLMMMSCPKTTSPRPATSDQSCEVVSGVDDAGTNIVTNNNDGADDDDLGRRSRWAKPLSAKERKIARRQLSRKSAFQPIAKAKREEARARARERTEKLRIGKQIEGLVDGGDDQAKNKQELRRLSSWSPFENGEESASGTQSHNNNMNFTCVTTCDPANSFEAVTCHQHDEVEEPISCCRSQEYLVNVDGGTNSHEALVVMGKWSPSSNFNSLLQNTSTATATATATAISQEQHLQFADFQFFGKLNYGAWEVYNTATHDNLF